jgi:serine protease Do
MFKKSLFIIIVIIISGLSGIVFDRYFFPYLAATKLFSKYEILKKSAENVTVINKTEQVYVKEESSLDKIAAQIASSVVNVVSYPNPDIKNSGKNIAGNLTKNGTGLIITSDGLVMTYLSVINPENSKYKVLGSDGNAYDAELSGIDSWSNLAFFKINASNLPAVTFGNSDDVKAGEKVIAIGNSQGGYQNSYVSGQISDFNPTYNISGKAVSMSDKLEGVFDIDSNFGKKYTGGPLVDYSGQVIAVFGSIDREGGTDYFGITGNKIKSVIDRAIKKEMDKNYQLGIYYIPITKTYALANNLAADSGAMIYSSSGQQGLAIISGSPASRSDLKINDIITQVNGEKISENKSLPDLLYKYKKGDRVELTLIRNSQEMKTSVQM